MNIKTSADVRKRDTLQFDPIMTVWEEGIHNWESVVLIICVRRRLLRGLSLAPALR